MTIITDPEVAEFVLAFADDEHMVGARHAEWIGTAPFLEEDLAFCSIAQDELGHALGLYALLTDDIDRFALLRDPADYRSCHLAERDAASWDDALVRHWLYDTAEALRWAALESSSIPELAALARRPLREEAFHTTHATMFLERVVNAATRPAIVAAVERLLPDALALFEPVAGEQRALELGVGSRSSGELADEWTASIQAALADLGLIVAWPPDSAAASHSAQAGRTVRSAGFAEFLDSLQSVISLDPAAVW
ncbi:MAG: 1,2-phenylacetyl-CoA epoxidase subunit PaaC [Acidimicrobiales bacterium]